MQDSTRCNLQLRAMRYLLYVPWALFCFSYWATCIPVKRGWHTYEAKLTEDGGERKRPLVTEPKWLSGNLQFPSGIQLLSRILENSIAKPPAGRLNRATYIDRSRNEAANPLASRHASLWFESKRSARSWYIILYYRIIYTR